jgi:hypothetical protein
MTDNQRAAETKAAFSIDEFCRRNSISRRTYYNLKEVGIGPREMKLCGAVRITVDAEADWHRARERAAGSVEAHAPQRIRRRSELTA